MILVTVGTTMPFDELLAEVDAAAASGVFGDAALEVQSGQSTYRMTHGDQFMAKTSLASSIAQASLVITHGGATVIQLLLAGKPFLAFPNPRGAGNHQKTFLAGLAEVADISWSEDVRDLARLHAERLARGPAVMRVRLPRAADLVREVWAGGK